MLEDLNKYESLELDMEEYAMVPIQMNLTFEDNEFGELTRSCEKDEETYYEGEDSMNTYFEENNFLERQFEEKDFPQIELEENYFHDELEYINYPLLSDDEFLRIEEPYNYDINMEQQYSYDINMNEDPRNYDFNMEEELLRSDEEIVPNFGVPFFIEEKYLEEEVMHRNGSEEEMETVNKVNEIFKNIELEHPSVTRKLVRYGVPYNEATMIVRKVIKLTLS